MIAVAVLMFIAVITFMLAAVSKNPVTKNQRLLSDKLDRLANRHELSFSRKDFFYNRVIAVDSKTKTLAFIDDFRHTSGVIRLNKITDCTVVNVNKKTAERKTAGGDIRHERIDSVLLMLKLNNGSIISFSFYDETQDGPLEITRLKEKADRWKQMITGSRLENKS